MRLEFDYLELSCFMSYEFARLEFTPGLFMVEGICEGGTSSSSNGAGKTTIFAALLWCFFAKTLRGLTHDEVINDMLPAGKTYVKVGARVDDIPLEVTRYRKHKEGKNSFEILLDGEDLSGPDAQAKLESILGVNYLVFINSILFGQSVSRFGEMTDSERKAILDNILDLHILTKAKDVTKDFKKDVDGDLTELDTERDILTERISGLKENIKNYKVQSETFHEDKSQEVLVAWDNIQSAEKKLEETDTKHGTALQNKTKADTLVTGLVEAVRLLDEEQVALTLESEQVAGDFENKLGRVEGSRDELQERLDGLEDLEGVSECPTCFQTLSGGYVEGVESHLQTELTTATAEVEKIQGKYDKAKGKVEKKQTAWSKKSKQKRQDKIAAERTQTRLVTEIKTLAGNITDEETAVSDAQAEYKLRQSKVNPYDGLIKAAEDKLSTAETALEDLEADVQGLQGQADLLDWWTVGFGNSGLRSFILDSIVPVLNGIADEYATLLTGGDIRVEFYTRKELKTEGKYAENFGFDVYNKYGKDSYTGSSSGERRRVDLLVLFALQGLLEAVSGFRSSLVMYDEVFDHLDPLGRELAVDLLVAEQGKRSTIHVITQEKSLREYFPQVITVRKINGLSSIES